MFVKLFAAFFLAYYFVNIAGMHMVIKRILKVPGRLKPFDCVTCLSVWFGLAMYLLPDNAPVIIFSAFGAGILATRIK